MRTLDLTLGEGVPVSFVLSSICYFYQDEGGKCTIVTVDKTHSFVTESYDEVHDKVAAIGYKEARNLPPRNNDDYGQRKYMQNPPYRSAY